MGSSTEDVGHFKARTTGSEWECNGPIVPHCFAGAKLQSKRGASQRTLDISKRAQEGVSGSVMAHRSGAQLQRKMGAAQMTLDISKRAQEGVSGSVMAPLFPIVLLLRSCRENEEQHRRRWTFQSTHNRE